MVFTVFLRCVMISKYLPSYKVLYYGTRIYTTRQRRCGVESVRGDSSMTFQFELIATDGRARAARLSLHPRESRTPMFMPVGTQGACASPLVRNAERGQK